MTKFSDNDSPSLLFTEQGSTPTSPAASHQRLFVRSSDHVLCTVNSSGTVVPYTSGGISDPMTTRGDIIVRNSSNVTARLGRGSANTVLQSDGTDVSYGSVLPAHLDVSADVTTANATSGHHGFLPKLSGSSSDVLKGDGTFGAGGGGASTSFLGYNTAGASWETLTVNRHIFKKFTMSAAGWITCSAYLRPSTDNVAYLISEVVTDNSNAPGVLIASNALGTTYLSNSSSMPGAGRWVGMITMYIDAAGDYWFGFTNDQTRFDLAYDGSGSDQYFTASLLTATGAYTSAWSITTGTRKYSMRIAVLS